MTTALQTGMVFFLSVSIPFAITACSEPATLDLEVIVPEQGADPFEGASKVTIRAGDKESSSTIDEAGQSFDTKVTLPQGTQTTVSLEGRDASGRLLCSGQTPPLYAVGNSETLRLWVSRQGAWSLHPATLDQAMTRPSMVTYEQTVWETLDHQPLYTFWFGGCDESGLPVDSVGYFDPYYQTIVTYPGLGDQDAWTDPATPVEPRCGAAAMSLPDGTFIIFGGQDDSGLPTDELDLAVASGSQFNYTAIPLECADGQDNDGDGLTDEDDEDCASRWDASERPNQDWAVAFPQVATLGPYASLWDDTVYRVTTSFLLLGGRGVDGPSDMALHVLAEQSADGLSYRFRIEPMTMFAARAGHCAAAGLLREGDMETRTVLVVGGTGDATDGVAAEYFQFKHDTSTSAMDWEWTHERLANDDQGDPLPLLYDAACAEVSRGRILACGGKTADGHASADCYLFLPADHAIKRLAGVLGDGRHRLALVRQGDVVLAVGGENEAGDFLTDTVVMSVEGTEVTALGSIPLDDTGLEGAGVFVVGNGQPALLGGTTASGDPSNRLWIANVRAEDLAQ